MAPACTIYPEVLPLSVRQEPKLAAEVRVYDALRRQMPEGWTVFYDVAWLGRTHPAEGPRDGQTDFIVAHPARGILLIEVKGGRIRYDGPNRQWISTDRDGVDHDIDPFEQVKQSKYALLNKLKEVPQLKTVWIELAHAVAFPDVARPTHAVTTDAPPEIVIGMEELNRLPTRIEEIFAWSRQKSGRDFEKGLMLVDELTKLIARSIVLPNPLAVLAAAEYEEMIELTEAQVRTLARLQRVRRAALGGCAGCGKTFLAAAKAEGLARQGFRTLLVCYTRPLHNFLRTLARKTDNLDVLTAHALARHLLPSLPAVADAAAADRLYPEALLAAMAERAERPYDAIVVDEGQDFTAEWWIALESCLGEGKESVLYVFYDSHQALIHGRSDLPTDLIEIPLEENVRNTQTICEELARHYRGDVSILPRGPAGRKVLLQPYTDGKDLARLLGAAIHQLTTTERFDNRDLIVLTPRPSLDQSDLPGLKLPHGLRLVADEPAAKGKDVWCCTAADFKGLERKVALVAEVDERLPADPTARDVVLYVAFSRPRHHLIVYHTPAALPVLRPPA